MSSLALQRLAEERKNFRRDRPFGFSAKPDTKADGSVNLLEWSCIVPGKTGTIVEGGKFPVTMKFGEDFPARPPSVSFPRGFFHVNIFPDGHVCLSILKTDLPAHLAAVAAVDVWKPGISIKQILLSVQELLHNPNFGSIANPAAYDLKQKSGMAAYEKRMKEQARRYATADD